jgi:hypothetical protein
VALLVICPSANAIIALTFASYVLQALFPKCEPPPLAVELLAAAVIGKKGQDVGEKIDPLAIKQFMMRKKKKNKFGNPRPYFISSV